MAFNYNIATNNIVDFINRQAGLSARRGEMEYELNKANKPKPISEYQKMLIMLKMPKLFESFPSMVGNTGVPWIDSIVKQNMPFVSQSKTKKETLSDKKLKWNAAKSYAKAKRESEEKEGEPTRSEIQEQMPFVEWDLYPEKREQMDHPSYEPAPESQMMIGNVPVWNQRGGNNKSPELEPSKQTREKGKGFFGELQRPDGRISTELSIGVNLDGREIEIPSLVPTLTETEKNFLLNGNKPTPTIVKKAVDHARKRMKEGKSPFAQEGEQQDQYGYFIGQEREFRNKGKFKYIGNNKWQKVK